MTTYYLPGIKLEDPSSLYTGEPSVMPYGDGVALRAEIDIEQVLSGSRSLYVPGATGSFSGMTKEPKMVVADTPSTLNGHTVGLLNIPKNFILQQIVVRSILPRNFTTSTFCTGVGYWTGLSSRSMLTEFHKGTMALANFKVTWPQTLKMSFAGAAAVSGIISVSIVGFQIRHDDLGL